MLRPTWSKQEENVHVVKSVPVCGRWGLSQFITWRAQTSAGRPGVGPSEPQSEVPSCRHGAGWGSRVRLHKLDSARTNDHTTGSDGDLMSRSDHVMRQDKPVGGVWVPSAQRIWIYLVWENCLHVSQICFYFTLSTLECLERVDAFMFTWLINFQKYV